VRARRTIVSTEVQYTLDLESRKDGQRKLLTANTERHSIKTRRPAALKLVDGARLLSIVNGQLLVTARRWIQLEVHTPPRRALHHSHARGARQPHHSHSHTYLRTNKPPVLQQRRNKP